MSPAALQVLDPARRPQAQVRQLAQPRPQHPLGHPVLDDVAERGVVHLPVVVMEEQGRGPGADPAVGDPDVQDRLGPLGHGLPQAQAGQGLLGAPGDRRGPAVEGLLQGHLRVLAIDQHHGQSGARQGHRQGRTHHAGAHHQHVAIL
jgi:hypothetical protein